jgi:replicative DNA helicase
MSTHEAERAVIGCVLADPGVMADLVDLGAHHFHLEHLGRLWSVVQSIRGPVTLATVIDEATRNGIEVSTVLECHAPAAAGVAGYRDIVIEGWRERQYRRALESALARVGGRHRVASLSWELIRAVQGIAASAGEMSQSFEDVAELWASELHDRLEGIAPPGVSWGLSALDQGLGMLRRGKLVVLAARPAMGKSALAQQIAEHLAETGEHVVFAQTEMSPADMLTRSVSRRTRIPSRNLIDGRITVSDLPRIEAAQAAASSLPLWIIDRPALTVEHIQAEAARRNASIVVVDYLQRIHSDHATEYDRVSAVSAGLKDLTRGGGPSVLALAQLSRTIEQRADKMPMASDLRSSGQIEQDADLILGLLRPAVYDEAEPPEDMLLGVIKHREGVPGAVIRLNWHGPTTSVSDPARERR